MAKFDDTIGDVHIHVDTSSLEADIQKAQKYLDMQVLKDSTEYVPFEQGALRSSGHIVQDGVIEWNTPYAHYQYIGELYLTEDGRSWASAGEVKYPTGIPLVQHAEGTTPQWFETAKQNHLATWIDTVRRIVRNR